MPQRTCKTCGLHYEVDESADFHMDPPVDYRRGYQKYCLACWLGVGPTDHPQLDLEPRAPLDDAGSGYSYPAQEDGRLRARRARMRDSVHVIENAVPPRPSVYLWLCCEGWMKFGPFEWLRFDDEAQAILGPDGEEVANKCQGQWRVPGEKWQAWGFSDPTITTTREHPHKNSRSHPGKRR